jgi:hypothetical protein
VALIKRDDSFLQDAGLLQMDKLVGFYADQIALKLAPDLQLPVSVVAEALRKLLQERRAAAPSIAPRAADAPKPDVPRPAGTAPPAIGSKSSAPKTPPSSRAARSKPGARKGRRSGTPRTNALSPVVGLVTIGCAIGSWGGRRPSWGGYVTF